MNDFNYEAYVTTPEFAAALADAQIEINKIQLRSIRMASAIVGAVVAAAAVTVAIVINQD